MIQHELRIQKKKEQDDTLSILDTLRKTRISRGGVGAPLDVPRHLENAIVVTDDEFKQTR